MEETKTIILAGNPNVGKSTIFNYLTGLKQHTGNWSGKTVSNAKGKFKYKDENYQIIDIPGTYSLNSRSEDEYIARDYICFEKSDATVIVCDATALERNLALVLQTIEIKEKVIVCVNLLDEAKKKGVNVNLKQLEEELGVYIVGSSAIQGKGIDKLLEKIRICVNKKKDFSKNFKYEEAIEKAIKIIENELDGIDFKGIKKKFVAIKLLKNEREIIKKIEDYVNINFDEKENISQGIKNAKYYLGKMDIKESDLDEKVYSSIYKHCEEICKNIYEIKKQNYYEKDVKLDKILTSKKYGIPIMLLLLSFVFWLTITGSNYPSQMLADCLFYFEDKIKGALEYLLFPKWLISFLVDGIYKVVAWVVSVMLPPMAIFFPMFTLLEDFGYLPRVAFNLDNIFRKCSACGKQALTMAMGFGCNAVGVTGCRIIDSPRERLIAILTNSFVPCNGRFPILISVVSMFFIGVGFRTYEGLFSAVFLTCIIVIGVLMTFVISKILSKTILKGVPSNFTLELPPYRKPQVVKTIVRSIFDRTLFVLGRAIIISIPAGIIIWLMANLTIGGENLLSYTTNFLDPFAKIMGLDGVILMGFILGLPANEIVIPIIIMAYMKGTVLIEIDNLSMLKELFISNGWTINTAICTILFTLFHYPCSTTLLTIKKETGSLKWTALAFIIPTGVGVLMCSFITLILKIFGL